MPRVSGGVIASCTGEINNQTAGYGFTARFQERKGNAIELRRERTIAVRGPKPEDFSFALRFPDRDYQQLLADISIAILQSIHVGYDTFLVGMDKGFEILCGESARRLREIDESFKKIKVVGVLPRPGYEPRFGGEWKERFRALEGRLDETIYLAGHKENGVIPEKGRFMVAHADALLCYCNGKDAAVKSAVDAAIESGVRLINLANRIETG
ncbi:MAG: SLOG family protein [Christensenellaceae bacterium]